MLPPESPEPPATPDNVVHLRFKRSSEDLPPAPIKKAKTPYRRFCTSHYFEYDRDERTVSCGNCGRNFDAFEAFEHLAQQWSHYDYTHRDVRGEITELRGQREAIKKQVANLKAQRRRLVPNVRQDIERVKSELWRHSHEKNPEIAAVIMRTINQRLQKVLTTIDKFGEDTPDEEPKESKKTK